MKVRLTLHRSYGDIEIEAESFDQIVDRLRDFPEWLDVIDSVISAQTSGVAVKEALSGIVESTADGPVIAVARDRITDKEAAGLLLYATDPQGLRPKDLGRYLSLSGFLSVGFASRLSEMKHEGLVFKQDDQYKLTVAGKRWLEGVVKTLKAGGG